VKVKISSFRGSIGHRRLTLRSSSLRDMRNPHHAPAQALDGRHKDVQDFVRSSPKFPRTSTRHCTRPVTASTRLRPASAAGTAPSLWRDHRAELPQGGADVAGPPLSHWKGARLQLSA